MPTPVKICGLSTPETVRAAVEGGAGYVGFMFFDNSPRKVTPQAAARLAEPARAKGVKVVAVTVDPSDALLEELRETLKPDLLQLPGPAAWERSSTGRCFPAAVSRAHGSSPAASTRGTSPRRSRLPAHRWWTFPLAWSVERG